jgi:4-hydroxy-2-oxoheptanedioate aldolase
MLGAFVTLKDPAITEMVGLAGYDFAFIDLEHGGMSLETVENHLRAAKAYGLGTLVRLPDGNRSFIQRVLDIGAEGIVIPHVTSTDAVAEAVAAVRFPPLGRRGLYATSRAVDYSAHNLGSYSEAVAELNRSVVLACIIEDSDAIRQCNEIVATAGLDVVIVGHADLSGSLNLISTRNNEVIGSAITMVADACKSAAKHLCLGVEHNAYWMTASDAVAFGAKVLLAGMDRKLLVEGFTSTRDRMAEGIALKPDLG